MLKRIQQRANPRNRCVKLVITVFFGLIWARMVTDLRPGVMNGTTGGDASPDAVATVAGQKISAVDFQQEFDRITRSQTVPPMLKAAYSKQILDQMIFQHALKYEAD